MKLGEHVESALHLCSLLADLPPGRWMPVGRVAEYYSLPAAALAKLLQGLAEAGVVEGRTGRVGGYRLARPPEHISALDVVLAVQGREPMFRCREIRQRGPCADAPGAYRSRCGIARLMDDAEAAWRDVLARCSVADLTRKMRSESSAHTRQATQGWLQDVFGRTEASQ